MIPAFSVSPRVAAKYQDAIAAHMLATLPQRPVRNLPSKATRISARVSTTAVETISSVSCGRITST